MTASVITRSPITLPRASVSQQMAREERGVDIGVQTPGFAAQGKVCELKATDTTPGTCDSTSRSIAEGVTSYDSTTGTHAKDGTQNVNPE